MFGIRLNKRQKFSQVKLDEILGDFSCARKEDIAYSVYYKPQKYIVYIDSGNEVHWETTEAFEEEGNKLATEAVIAINSLKHKPTATQFDSRSRFLFNCILGNVLVAAFSAKRAEYENALKEAEDYLGTKELETTRVWYVEYSLAILAVLTLLYFLLLFLGSRVDAAASILKVYQYLYWSAIGSTFSILQSTDKISYTCSAGRELVFMEILCKFVIGMISGGILIAAFDIKLIFSGMISESSEPVFKLLLCILAGLSEKLVPSLVERLEKVEQPAPDSKVGAVSDRDKGEAEEKKESCE